ncbi:MAG: trypsin-like peptidase domain-containing protein [Burkholderiaceae bacterium]
MTGDHGPDTLFEFSPVLGPARLSTPRPLGEVEEHVELLIDGRRFEGVTQELKPGTRVQIHDRATDESFDLLVDEPPFWVRRLRVWLILGLSVAVGFALYGAYVYQLLGTTEKRLTQAETRLADAEQDAQRIDAQLAQTMARFESRELAIDRAFSEIRATQDQSQARLRAEFSAGLKAITTESQLALSQTAELDYQAREAIAAEAARRVESLRQEVSDKAVTAFDRFRKIEQEVFVRNAQRLDTLEVQGKRFKKILADSTKAVLFVWTRYSARLGISDEEKEVYSAGTAFLLDTNGLAVAPQHVFEPWRYDDEFLALNALGLIELVPGSVVRYVWLAGQQVIEPGSQPANYLTDKAFSDESEARRLLVLHRPEPKTASRLVTTPLGIAQIDKPLAGPSDLVVFQLATGAGDFPALSLLSSPGSIAPLDEVLVVGYPMARLDDGRSVAQGVKGFVRRVGPDLLELDSALHPGSSGAPVLDSRGQVVGMAVAMFGSESYGAAVPWDHIQMAITQAQINVQVNEARLRDSGCNPGPVDGVLDDKTWEAIRSPGCEFRSVNGQSSVN